MRGRNYVSRMRKGCVTDNRERAEEKRKKKKKLRIHIILLKASITHYGKKNAFWVGNTSCLAYESFRA